MLKKYKGFIKKSRFLDLSVLVGVLGIVVENLPLLKTYLAEYYGFVFIGLSVIMYILRLDTKGPVGMKD